MTGDLINSSLNFDTKKDLYLHLASQVKSFVEFPNCKIVPQANTTIALANSAALLFYELNRYARPEATLQNLPINWLGFYLLQSTQLLALGPFQGRPACTVIPIGRGVCGAAVQKGESLRVANVNAFPGHIACDSASNSEIVVPILSPGGHVLGVLDVDSVLPGFFDEEDQVGLERIAHILAEHLELPMSRIFATNPMLAKSPFPHTNTIAGAAALAEATPVAAAGLEAHRVALPETSKLAAVVLSHAPSIAAKEGGDNVWTHSVQPRHLRAEIGGWEFAATEFTRILTQEEVRQYEEELHIEALPEIQFAFNTLTITPSTQKGTPLISFRLYDVLKSAGEFYQTATYKDVVAGQVTIPVAESWKNTPYKVFDTNVDWAWRNDYYGVDKTRCSLQPLEQSMPGINWDVLKDQTRPILFFHKFDMMEDDIHDHGIVSSSVRVRAMSEAFFILFRHFIRIDRHLVWMREVRLFHEYNVKLPNGQPHIVFREEIRSLNIDDNEKWYKLGTDEISREANLVEAHDYYLQITNPSDLIGAYRCGVMELLKKTALFRVEQQTKGLAAEEVTDISLSGVPLLQESLARFTALTHLTLVSLKPHITDLQLIGLDAFSSLRMLDVSDNAIAVSSALPVCPSLRRLFISNNKITQWEELQRLASAFPSLEILDITDNAACENSRFAEIFDLFPNLCALNSKTRDGEEVAVAESDESGSSSEEEEETDEDDEEEDNGSSVAEDGENESASGVGGDAAIGESEPPLKQPRIK